MASLGRHQSGVFRVRFRFGGRQWYRSLDTNSKTEARQIATRIERTLLLIKSGDICLPPKATAEQTWLFLRSGGRVSGEPDIAAGITLGDAIDQYFADIPPGAKEDSSLGTEHIHAGHLRRIFRPGTPLQEIGLERLQFYVNSRSKRVRPYTVRKEIGTYHQIWSHAKARKLVTGEFPKKHLKFPRSPEKPPFQTCDQIERAIEGGSDDGLWKALFLWESEVLEVLQYVHRHAAHPFIHPMVAFAALTGARRSEILRSETSDFDLDRGVVLIREKKRVRAASLSFRRVDMPRRLISIMGDWLAHHPGGQYTICSEPGRPLTKDSARGYLRRAMRGHEKWTKIRGFHVFRHSFASICALRGVHQSIIDAWMGHQTDEMRRRYRHLFPEETHAASAALFNGAAD